MQGLRHRHRAERRRSICNGRFMRSSPSVRHPARGRWWVHVRTHPPSSARARRTTRAASVHGPGDAVDRCGVLCPVRRVHPALPPASRGPRAGRRARVRRARPRSSPSASINGLLPALSPFLGPVAGHAARRPARPDGPAGRPDHAAPPVGRSARGRSVS